MTRAEWEQLAELMEGWWPGEFADHEQAAYFVVLERFPGEQVAGSVRAVVDTGAEFRPSAPVLVAHCAAREKSLLDAARRALPARPAGRNASKLELAWESDEQPRAVGPHRDCGGMLHEVEPSEARGGGWSPQIVQCERCREVFGRAVTTPEPEEAAF